MGERDGYGQFCPVSMASEVLCSRWTTLVVREFLCGSTRFNELRRGLPKMSPALLSKRLKELEQSGIIATRSVNGITDYQLTSAGEELRPLITGLGNWAQRWMESRLSLKNLDPSLLMWDMRRNLDTRRLPPRRYTIQFLYPELSAKQKCWWIVIENGKVDLCNFDPGYDVDLLVEAALRSMTAIWMGLSTIRQEVEAETLRLEGDKRLARDIQEWLGLSVFAKTPRMTA